MLTAGLVISILLSAAALWVALVRSRASKLDAAARAAEVERAEHLLSELRTRIERETGAIRGLVEAQGELIGRLESRCDALPASPQKMTRRERKAARKLAVESRLGAGVGAEDGAEEPAGVGSAAEAEAEPSSPSALAHSLEQFYKATRNPRDLLGHVSFERGVELLRDGNLTTGELLARTIGTGAVFSCMALEALARREGDDEIIADSVLRDVNSYDYWPRFYALRVLAAHPGARGVLARLLARLNSTWRDEVPLRGLREFVAVRVTAGEVLAQQELLAEVKALGLDDEELADVAATLQEIGPLLPPEVRIELSHWAGWRETAGYLKAIGRVWGEGDGAEVFVLDSVAARVAELEAALRREPARSVLLVGDSGTGKTALVRALAARLRRENWLVFEAAASEVMAGQTYIGQIEERVREIVQQVEGKRVLWVMPNFHEAMWSGRHRYSPTGLLDLLLPSIESGAVKIVGELTAEAYEQLLRLRPRLRNAMQVCRVAPLSDEDTLELGRRWAVRRGKPGLAWEGLHEGVDTSYLLPRASAPTLGEALQLAKQYLGDKAAPGNLLLLLDATDRRLLAEESKADEIKLDDLLVTLSQLTGLPVQILDERVGLDLAELRAFFERRVLGQPEAVDCLVERVAMIKAGLTDPTRPQGVFLFVGPTGTGKTEIAKTLAEFLFGSPERMLRLDMSELQTWESQARILGESEETSDSAALVNLIRKQPFSVVLLDEFEKAHPSVWDLFLQVFDDGRLTDRRGNTADFRHSVIILTSNLGATLPHGASVGFAQEQSQFAAGSVERAVGRAFRREFVNRIDRVVVFRPLGRGVMRDLLRKELNDVLTRRGLRTRQWAVEWDESAVEFLLEKGFTADLGARPLKRAVERYLLSPLALTIVNHQFPEGDQFLFVRSSADGQALDVQFVDPDAPERPQVPDEESEVSTFDEEGAGELRLESVALDPKGTPEELRLSAGDVRRRGLARRGRGVASAQGGGARRDAVGRLLVFARAFRPARRGRVHGSHRGGTRHRGLAPRSAARRPQASAARPRRAPRAAALPARLGLPRPGRRRPARRLPRGRGQPRAGRRPRAQRRLRAHPHAHVPPLGRAPPHALRADRGAGGRGLERRGRRRVPRRRRRLGLRGLHHSQAGGGAPRAGDAAGREVVLQTRTRRRPRRRAARGAGRARPRGSARTGRAHNGRRGARAGRHRPPLPRRAFPARPRLGARLAHRPAGARPRRRLRPHHLKSTAGN